MKQITLNIPDNKYLAFINHIKNKFADIQIKEKRSDISEDAIEDESISETTFLSEKSLAEDWLSDEDNRWDEVL